jgi:hypothetical protein
MLVHVGQTALKGCGMASSSKAKAPSKAAGERFETRRDGWQRFEKAVDAAVKSGPKHRTTAQPMAQKRSAQKKKAAKPPSR